MNKILNLSSEHSGIRWRRYRPRLRVLHNPFGLVPLVNLALLILLFMLLQAAFVRQPAYQVQLPAGAFLSGAPQNLMVVTLTQEGLLFFDDERLTLEALAMALKNAVRDRKAAAIVIEADVRVPYGVIARVMNMATAAGIKQIDLATRPSFGEEVMP
ncbi:MAG: biopolymer transporter ExbD [Lentisphaerae bacterium]|nr:biopolymer transporter ExbD [Lentisphaerota bacterium]